jgi:hypothetical protein
MEFKKKIFLQCWGLNSGLGLLIICSTT